jgi:GNAT superfamily N-acetyltransferase
MNSSIAPQIRSANIGEAELIHDLIYQLAVYEKAPELALATVDQIRTAFFGHSPAVFCDLILTESGEVAGLAIWFLNFSTWTGTHGIYLEDLFVLPQYRGRGYGKALLKHLARLCVERGCHRFQWWVLDWNAPAIAFYQSLGATLMDEWTVMRVQGQALSELAK